MDQKTETEIYVYAFFMLQQISCEKSFWKKKLLTYIFDIQVSESPGLYYYGKALTGM